jgi:hypothetical protein
MQYLTYEKYLSIGGTLDSTAFNRNIDRACGIIDNATHNRIEPLRGVPKQVEACCRDLVEYLARYSVLDTAVSSRSQSAGGVSESESYAVKTADNMHGDIDNILCDYLLSLTDKNGTPLLYRGCSR